MKTFWFAFPFLAALLVVAGCSQRAATVEPKPIRWEYHVEKVESYEHKESAKLVGQISKPGILEKDNDLAQSMGTFIFDDKLQELGKEGWELVGSFVEPETVWPKVSSGYEPPVKMTNVRGGELVLIFKRPF